MAANWAVFHLTDRCQLACQHCLRDPSRAVHDLPVELIDRVLAQARRIYRTDHVGLTGGEPSLHPRFADVLDAIVRHGLTWHMVTNGGRFDHVLEVLAANPRHREALTAIDLSLDGADEATHDGIRGPGSFRAVMAAAARCAAFGIPFVLQMTVNARNLAQIEPLGLLGTQLGAKRVSFGMTQPTGTAHDESLRLNASQWRGVLDRVVRLGEALRIEVSANEGFPREHPFHCCEPFRSEILHVDPLGRLTLCCALTGVPGGEGREVLADLREVSLADAHRKMLEEIQRFQLDKLAAMERGELDDWDLFPCNYCMKYFGKPYWTDAGATGPRARRARTASET